MRDSTEPSATGPATRVAKREGLCSSADGLELHWRSWLPPHPVGVIVVTHGLAEHGGRYHETAEYFAAHGWAVYAGDLRGHGRSPDVPGAGRVHVRRFTDYFMDIDAFTNLALEQHADLPLFLLGHSMGGLITISYVLRNSDHLAGAVISSPALGTHPDFKPPALLRLLVSVLDRLAPRLRFPSDLDTNAISRDPEVVQAYLDDPLVSQKVSARWYAEILRSIKRAHEDAPALRTPVLLMQSGADRLVDPAAPARWANLAPPGQVELVHWEGLYHEMFNEPERLQVRRRVLDWLLQRMARLTAHSDQAETLLKTEKGDTETTG
jgi:alpha-beta hydrolase superfamily lysophospholipase